MKVFYSNDHELHHPPFEIFEYGQQIRYYEQPARIENIFAALNNDPFFKLTPAENHGLEPILRVHSPEYVNFLRTIYRDWLASGEDIPDGAGLFPTARPLRQVSSHANSLSARLGKYVSDLSAPIHENTYLAALSSAHCAISAANSLLKNEEASAALCRPPGHHAGIQNAAGYCYLNNTSIAANLLSKHGRTAVLDIDYHAGNGTQEIFYSRADVLTISIHADPSHEYPYYSGFSDEIGAGDGEGFHQNYPLSKGCSNDDYMNAFDQAIKRISQFEPQFLVIAAGLDTYKDDPLGTFHLTGKNYSHIGKTLKELGVKTLINLEGGYCIEKIGESFRKLLSGFK